MKNWYRGRESDEQRVRDGDDLERPRDVEKWRIAQRTRPRRNPETSSSDCSCSSCGSYRRRKEKIRRRQKKERTKKRKHKEPVSEDWDSDQSGLIAARRGVVTERYGKYGLITEFDKPAKEAEFHQWLLEVKNKSLNCMSGHDERKIFEEFVEEYNTATFPSKKFYDLAKWEAHMLKKRSLKVSAEDDTPGSAGRLAQFDDEKLRREEIRREREKEKRKELDEALETLKRDKDVVEAMRRQKALRLEMDYLFKTGKIEQAREIQALLRADPRSGPTGAGNTAGDEEFDIAAGGGGADLHSYRHGGNE